VVVSVHGTKRRFAAAQYSGRFWGEADIQRAALTEPDLLGRALALQLRFFRASESMGNHDSKIVDAGIVD
jgi:hypothetical protein